MSGTWGHIDEARDVWAGRGGSCPSSMGHERGRQVDEAWDMSTIYASVLEYIHLHARASAANREQGGEAIYVDKNLMRNRSMQTTEIWTFFSAVCLCDRQGQEQ